MCPANTNPSLPISKKREDLLNHYFLANRIVQTLKGKDSGASLKIGIFGEWGSGKTGIHNLTKEIFQEEENKDFIFFDFNPWGAKGEADLWNSFGTEFVIACNERNLPLKNHKKISGRFQRIRQTKEYRKLLKLLDEFTPAAKSFSEVNESVKGIVGGSLNLLKKFMRFDSGVFSKYDLTNYNFVVFIDDLDRVPPQIIPPVLYALHELSSIPKFSFIFCMDDEVVKKSLEDFIKGWEKGKDVLGKFIDFSLGIPEINAQTLEGFVSQKREEICPFIPFEILNELCLFFERNPRKIIQTLRQIAILKPEIDRHRFDEYNLKILIIFQIIKFSSSKLVFEIFEKDTFDRLISLSVEEKGADYRKKKIEEICKGEKFKFDEKETKRFTNLIERIYLENDVRIHNEEFLEYHAFFGDTPVHLTWKEFDEYVEFWGTHRKLKKVADRLLKHCQDFKFPQKETLEEFITTAIGFRDQELNLAADTSDKEGYQKHAQNAEEALNLLEETAKNGLPGFEVSKELKLKVFSETLRLAFYWAHFVGNEKDINLRKEELKSLKRLIGILLPTVGALSILEKLCPWGDWGGTYGAEKKKTIIFDLLKIIEKPAIVECVDGFLIKNWINSLRDYQKGQAGRYYLFSPDSEIYKKGALQNNLFKIWGETKENQIVHQNCYEFLVILSSFETQQRLGLNQENVKKILSNQNLVIQLWEAVTKRPRQYRAQDSFLKVWWGLQGQGVPPKIIQLPSWISPIIIENFEKTIKAGKH